MALIPDLLKGGLLPSGLEGSCQAEKDGKQKPFPASAPLLGGGGILCFSVAYWFTGPVWPAVAPPPPPAHTSL